jgi:branched-chain amino acid transport system ATP-binding protein
MFGRDMSTWPAHRRAAAGLGRSFQEARLWSGLTVQETIAVAVTKRMHAPGALASLICLPTVSRAERRIGREADDVIELFGLGDQRDLLDSDLSTGQRRLVELAVMVAMRPKIVLVDEPSAGIAQAESEALVPLLRRAREYLGCSVMLIEHDMIVMRSLAERIIAMDAGSVVAAGDPDQVLHHPDVVRSFLGTAASSL